MDDLSPVDIYRAITVIHVISKLLECIILRICSECFESDEIQFGFTQGVGCYLQYALPLNFYVNRDSIIFIAFMDISEAYDTVSHYKLYSSLLRLGCRCGWLIFW